MSKLIQDHEDKYGKEKQGSPHIWDEKVGRIQFAINAQQQASTKKQPFQMVFGRVPIHAHEVKNLKFSADTYLLHYK